jgi:hypothetical protein
MTATAMNSVGVFTNSETQFPAKNETHQILAKKMDTAAACLSRCRYVGSRR